MVAHTGEQKGIVSISDYLARHEFTNQSDLRGHIDYPLKSNSYATGSMLWLNMADGQRQRMQKLFYVRDVF